MTCRVDDTLEFLIGQWAIERSILDHRDGTRTTFSGMTEVVADGAGATYREAGTVRHGAHTGPARRTLHLSRQEDGSVRVTFADGRPFLELDLRSGVASATHPCRADRYDMSFQVTGPDEIEERWHVVGPEKDYRARTHWRRRPVAASDRVH